MFSFISTFTASFKKMTSSTQYLKLLKPLLSSIRKIYTLFEFSQNFAFDCQVTWSHYLTLYLSFYHQMSIFFFSYFASLSQMHFREVFKHICSFSKIMIKLSAMICVTKLPAASTCCAKTGVINYKYMI